MCSAVMAPSPGPFFIFCSPCLHSFSIRLSHALFTGPTSVCTLSAGRGWLRELPLHIFITWTIFMWAARLSSAGDERGLERCSRCVGSAWNRSVFFMWLGCSPGLFHLSCFFPSLYLCTVGDVWASLHFFSISCLLSLVLPLLAFFFLLPAAVFLHLILQAPITCDSSSSLYSPDLPLNLSTLLFFRLSVLPLPQSIISAYISRLQSSHDSLCVPSFLPRSCLHELQWLYLLVGLSSKGMRERQGRGSKACYSFLPSVWHVWRMEGDLKPTAL